MSYNLQAPWGTFKFDTYLGFFEQAKAQLEYYLKAGVSPEPEYTRQDLAGYEELLSLGSESTAAAFLHVKGQARARGESPTNQQVIALLKEQGRWGAP